MARFLFSISESDETWGETPLTGDLEIQRDPFAEIYLERLFVINKYVKIVCIVDLFNLLDRFLDLNICLAQLGVLRV